MVRTHPERGSESDGGEGIFVIGTADFIGEAAHDESARWDEYHVGAGHSDGAIKTSAGTCRGGVGDDVRSGREVLQRESVPWFSLGDIGGVLDGVKRADCTGDAEAGTGC